MSLTILGGSAKGATLAVPNSKNLRPTSVLLKRRFFDSMQSFEGAFFDICAGSGSMGFEALSRGASKVVFVEADPKSMRVIKKNYEDVFQKRGLAGEALFFQGDCLRWARQFQWEDQNSVFFFDPPYEEKALYQAFLKTFVERLKGHPLSEAKLVVEFCRQKTAPEEEVKRWLGDPDKIHRQGTNFLHIHDLALLVLDS